MIELTEVNQRLQAISQNFDRNVAIVDELMNFDKIILDLCINNLESLEKYLRTNLHTDNPKHLPSKTIKLLKNIRTNNSLKSQYETIFNQALVLLVSHFSSALHDIFKTALKTFIDKSSEPKILKEEIKISLEDLKMRNYNLSEDIANLFMIKKDYSFQDMQSTKRALEECFGYTPVKTSDVNNIILAQAARHVIVHCGAIIDERFIRQVSGAFPRQIKATIQLNTQITFDTIEIKTISASMKKYLGTTISAIVNNL
jgi:hypothetical protein